MAAETAWHKGWAGQRKFVPWSEKEGRRVAQEVLFPLQAEIAYLFGSIEGDIDSLTAGAIKLAQGEHVLCEACGRSIWVERHKLDCSLVAQYKDVRP